MPISRRVCFWRTVVSGSLAASLALLTNGCVKSSTEPTINQHADNAVCESVLPFVQRTADPFRTGSSSKFGSAYDLGGLPSLYLSSWLYALTLLSTEASNAIGKHGSKLQTFFRGVLHSPDKVTATDTGLTVLHRLYLAAQGYSLTGGKALDEVDALKRLRDEGLYRFSRDIDADLAATSLAVSTQSMLGIEPPPPVVKTIGSALASMDEVESRKGIAVRGEPVLTAAQVLIHHGRLEEHHSARIIEHARQWLQVLEEKPLSPGEVGTVKRLVDVILGLGGSKPNLEYQLTGIEKLSTGYYSIDGGRSADPQTTYYLYALDGSAQLPTDVLTTGLMPQGWVRLAAPTLQSTYYGAYISKACTGSVPEMDAVLAPLNNSQAGNSTLTSPSYLMMACQLSQWAPGAISKSTLGKLRGNIEHNLRKSSNSMKTTDLAHLKMASESCDANVPLGLFEDCRDKLQRHQTDAGRAAARYLANKGVELKTGIGEQRANSTNIWDAMWNATLYHDTSKKQPQKKLRQFRTSDLYTMTADTPSRVTLGTLAAAVQWSVGGNYAVGFAPQ